MIEKRHSRLHGELWWFAESFLEPTTLMAVLTIVSKDKLRVIASDDWSKTVEGAIFERVIPFKRVILFGSYISTRTLKYLISN